MNNLYKILVISSALLFTGCGSNDSHFNNENNSSENTPPVSNDGNINLNEDSSATYILDAIDKDGDKLTYIIITEPSYGSVSIIGNEVVYTPNVNYNGKDSFTYKANDGKVDSNIATILINVSPVNNEPISVNGTVTVNKNNSVDYTMIATDIDGDNLTYSIKTQPTNGIVTINGNISKYTPNSNYTGQDSFTFISSDGVIDSNIATVSITVNAINNSPDINIGTLYTGKQGLPYFVKFQGTDPDGDKLIYEINFYDNNQNLISMPNWFSFDSNNGELSSTKINYDSSIIYNIEVRVTDTEGLSSTAKSTINIVEYLPFVIKISTKLKSDASDNIFKIYSNFLNYGEIDWGDGTKELYSSYRLLSHTYSTEDEFIVKLYNIDRFTQRNFSDPTQSTTPENIIDVLKFGEIKWRNLDFVRASNMDISSTDIPNFKNMTNMYNMFSGAIKLNSQYISNWDTSTITNMYGTFSGATSFNQPLFWDTSKVTNMTKLFYQAGNFNGDINSWDVSKVTAMGEMFYNAYKFNKPLNNWKTGSLLYMNKMFSRYLSDNKTTDFNQNINSWDVSNVINMENLFAGATSFNQPLNKWNVSNVENMRYMFSNAFSFNQPLDNWDMSKQKIAYGMFSRAKRFNQNINSWDVSNIKEFNGMFSFTEDFNQPLDNWNVSKGVSFSGMFEFTKSFNQDISSWDVSKGESFWLMFRYSDKFNQPLNSWDMSSAKIISYMFKYAKNFNQPLNSWNVSNVTDFNQVFNGAGLFNQDISTWDVSKGENFGGMLSNTTYFNQDISSWDLGNAKVIGYMFYNARAFNQNINSWNVSNVTSFSGAFDNSGAFNQPLNSWNTSMATNMYRMFNSSIFNQDISGWNVSSVTDMRQMFSQNRSFDQDISGWNVDNVINTLNFDAYSNVNWTTAEKPNFP